jgi:hypothetical protein
MAEKLSPQAPSLGSPEAMKQVFGQASGESTEGMKTIVAPVAAVEGIVVAAAAAPEAIAAYGTANATMAAHPGETVQFAEGVMAGMSPGPSSPPPTLAGFAGYGVGKAVDWVSRNLGDKWGSN